MSEFKLKNFGFEHSNPFCLVQSQWRIFNPKIFTVYRIVLAICLIIWIIFDFTTEWLNSYQETPYLWLLFATNWAFVILVISHISLAFACMIHNCDQIPRSRVYGYKFCWLMYTLAANTILTTSAIYLSALLNSSQAIFNTSQSKLKHSLNAVIVLFDVWICWIPIRLFHGVYPICLGLFYTVFLVIYYAAGGTSVLDKPFVYQALYWHFPGRSVVAVICVIVMSIVVHILLYVLVQVRYWLYGVINDTDSDVAQQSKLDSNGDQEEDKQPIVGNGDDKNSYAAIE